jgi:hypothetical protein
MKAECGTLVARVKAKHGMEYLDRLPSVIPPGKALVHNSVRATGQLGTRGFRAWLVDDGDARNARRVVCDCGFAPELGTHYRMVWQSETH